MTTDDAGAEASFRAMRAVDEVVRVESRFTIRGRGEDFVTEVIRCVSDRQMHVADFRTELPNLEDVFLKVTGHSIRA